MNRKGCQIIQLPEGSTAIICGGKPDHVCNEDALIYLLKDGERVPVKYEDQKKFTEDHYTEIIGGSVACTICGRAAIDNAPYLEF
jgi:hypothetical protein